MHALVPPLAILCALAVDRCWGEPPVRWHPVVWMGHFLGRGGDWLQRHAQQDTQARDLQAFGLGVLVWIVGGAMVYIASWFLQAWLLAAPWWLAALGLGLLLKPLLAWALLRSEVQAVETALQESLEAGRARLRYLVSRDVSVLSATTVRESAIETLAENLNDSVVAPLFWFALLGLPGAALFRFANTADAMWGYPGVYQGKNWAWAGKWAARVDDVLGWVPARITALLLMVVGRGACQVWGVESENRPQRGQFSPDLQAHSLAMGQKDGEEWAAAADLQPTLPKPGRLLWQGLRRLRVEAARTPSPNSGWPMAAMALVLGVRLAKPGGYVLHAAGRAATAQDTRQALVFASNVLYVLVLLAFVAICLIAFWGGR